MRDGAGGRPSWFLVSEHDNSINGSHCAFVAQPVAVTNFIRKALDA